MSFSQEQRYLGFVLGVLISGNFHIVGIHCPQVLGIQFSPSLLWGRGPVGKACVAQGRPGAIAAEEHIECWGD